MNESKKGELNVAVTPNPSRGETKCFASCGIFLLRVLACQILQSLLPADLKSLLAPSEGRGTAITPTDETKGGGSAQESTQLSSRIPNFAVSSLQI